MAQTKGRRLLACYHEAGHALTRWFFGHGIDRVVVLTVEEVLAGVMVENRKGVAIQCEGVCEGYDIHGFPYGSMLIPGYDEAQQAEQVRHRAISRDMEFINCWAGACAEAAHRKVSLVAVLMAGGDGDLEQFRAILGAWGVDDRSPEGKAAWRFAETSAKALIRSPMGATAVQSIAETLHQRGELDGDEVAALCRDAYGGRECRFGAWTDHWPPTLAQIRAGHIPERRPAAQAMA